LSSCSSVSICIGWGGVLEGFLETLLEELLEGFLETLLEGLLDGVFGVFDLPRSTGAGAGAGKSVDLFEGEALDGDEDPS
jgi:hypothetical protein